jgi:two-component system, OmpR family, sensor histidine kinase SenX3
MRVGAPAFLAAIRLDLSNVELAAICAAIVVVAAVIVALAISRRRALRRRLSSVAVRLGDDTALGGAPSLEALLASLEQGTERSTEQTAGFSEEADRLRRSLDAMPQGVVVCDAEGNMRFRNSRAASMIESRHAEILAARAVEEMIRDAQPGQAAERTIELYGPPRRTLLVRTDTLDDHRQTLGVVAVLDDVSERRRLEAVRRDFVANVSHELKTPVGALGLLAETLLTEPDPAVGQRLAARIQAEAFRVSRIIDDLLDLSRLEAEESPPREPVHVDVIMGEALERVRAAADAAGVPLRLSEPTPSSAVLGDRRQLVTALHNLLENAVQYSDRGAEVTLEGGEQDGFVELSVRDRGIGIPARDLERIFERFYRVDQGRSRRTGGTGLGLAIVRHVAGNHGGSCRVESREGVGSTFTMRLPLAPRGGSVSVPTEVPTGLASGAPTAAPAGGSGAPGSRAGSTVPIDRARPAGRDQKDAAAGVEALGADGGSPLTVDGRADGDGSGDNGLREDATEGGPDHTKPEP